ncbi:MAG: hypothetical protein SGJ27_19090 [Candidatus Melainabacteria bacterium]|nr:hypothetical protein [Candidatus Melainabacteria bacterium]
MIKGKRVLAVVSAVGGCKTLRGRDSRSLVSKPLFLWTFEAAKNARLVDCVVIVTDDKAVQSLAHAQGLNTYSVSTSREDGMERLTDCALAALKEVADFDLVVALDAGSPLLLGSDIDGVVEVSARNDGIPVVTVSETRLTPKSLVVLDGNRKMNRVFGNQDPVPANSRIYTTNNSIAACASAYLKAHETFLTEDSHAFILPPERALVVESKTDLAVAESFLRLTGPYAQSVQSGQDISQLRS